jgi:hypothetical protein
MTRPEPRRDQPGGDSTAPDQASSDDISQDLEEDWTGRDERHRTRLTPEQDAALDRLIESSPPLDRLTLERLRALMPPPRTSPHRK